MAVYKGEKIVFEIEENKPVFKCHELDIECGSFDEIKIKIDEQKKKIAKAPKTPVLMWCNGNFICGVAGAEHKSSYYRSSRAVWVTWEKGSNEFRDRETKDINDLIIDTEENRIAMTKAHEKYLEGKAIIKEAEKVLESLLRFQFAD